ncbi:FAD-dependent oxidoreductase [Streptomyces sp. HNM0574]|uniref:FAD-dependent oxidoreductase n=1 Tax=Streptomyces sp. HNM0574 TaxID=2714954 RepID=UPI00146EBC46|nr:FAD-dependent oxidoreductase [Streptomyces sp. HNM0574]
MCPDRTDRTAARNGTPLRVAVVGSGPSGVYAAQGLAGERGVTVDVLDRLPCPYGLVRYGVAPDHEKIKSLQNNLRQVLEQPGVRFLGNIEVGPGGIGPRDLLRLYDAVVYCVGAATDRTLGIPGEELRGSYSATGFVSWYSGHPDSAPDGFPLAARSAVVIGVGNVAVDVTRVLARAREELRPTDVPQDVLERLADSRVRRVTTVGRRGPSQAKFTTKELRELGTLPGTTVRVRADELAADPLCAAPDALSRAAQRNVEVLRGWSAPEGTPEPETGRLIELRFCLRPVEILGDAEGAVRGVRFERMRPDGTGAVTGTGEHEEVPAQLVLRSVGYRGVPLAGLPFDAETGTVPHLAGRVLRDGRVSRGEYVAGWIKRGPTGVIGTNRPCAKETVTSLLADARALAAAPGRTPADPLTVLRYMGLRPVEWSGWLGIEDAETTLGRSLGRSRVKIPARDRLLAAASDALWPT